MSLHELWGLLYLPWSVHDACMDHSVQYSSAFEFPVPHSHTTMALRPTHPLCHVRTPTHPAHCIPCAPPSRLTHHVPHALSIASHMPCLSRPTCPAHPVPHLRHVHPPRHLTWTPSLGPPPQDVSPQPQHASPRPQHHTQPNIPVGQDVQHIWVYPFSDHWLIFTVGRRTWQLPSRSLHSTFWIFL